MSTRPLGTLSIAATFTADPILPSLGFMMERAGLGLEIQLAPYHQVFQELLSDSSLLGKSTQGVNLILIRLEDFVRDEENKETAIKIIERTACELGDALVAFGLRAKIPTIVSIFPPTSRVQDLFPVIIAAGDTLAEHVRAGLTLLSNEEISTYCPDGGVDPVGDELAHIPYTRDYYSAIALAVARKAHAALVPAHKVLVLDCDNTLWQGVVGEDGVDGIEITESNLALQNFAIKAHARGTLICLASKNSEADVLDVFNKRPEMLLKLQHIVAHRINWNSKPQNIVSIAKQLNLGLDSFVFVDDSPLECNLMRAELPQVVTLQLPERVDGFLSNLWTFDKLAVTAEDRRRTELYKEEAARQAFEATTTGIQDFIASLDVRVDIQEPEENDWARLAQLTQRTNQFNFTTRRRTEPELRAFAKNDGLVRSVKVADRFGDYGLVGLVVAKLEPGCMSVDTLLLSCRVLGRGVEHTILRELAAMAAKRDLPMVAVDFIPTSKNEPAEAFIESVANRFRQPDGTFLIPTEDAAQTVHRPGFDPTAVIEASRQVDRKISANTSAVDRSDRYQKLADTLVSGHEVTQAVIASATRPRSLRSEPSPPTNEIERKLQKIWEEILEISGIGIDDDYAALGGSSLAAVRLFAEITRQFCVKLPLTTILSSSSIRTLAREIAQKASAVSSVLELKPGAGLNLFLVHDGDGETLLYANIARRLPADVAVFGINPETKPNIPLAHTDIEYMAGSYIQRVRETQPEGPYLLGGMCAGGLIAYEMASQLLAQGAQVELVLILDAATPQAQRKPYLTTKHRVSRASQMLKEHLDSNIAAHRRAGRLLSAGTRKVWNLLSWVITSRLMKWTVVARFYVLRYVLKQGAAWPTILPTLTFRQIYQRAEAAYTPKALTGPEIVLVRATVGEAGDTPYVNLYADDTFGWNHVVPHLRISDVVGGHYSMLQEPFVEDLTAIIRNALPRSASTQSIQPAA